MRQSLLHGIIFTSMLAATGCSAFAAGADPSHSARGAAWGLATDAAAGARPLLGRAEFRAGPSARSGIGIGNAPEAEADAPFIVPIEVADTIKFAPGALLDVWLNDERRDLRAITSERSLGTAVVQGDFFRYTSINSDPDLRGFWGQRLLLKWSAILEIPDSGQHVFVSELSRERDNGAMRVRTLVRVNEETVFENDVRVFLTNRIFEVDHRPLTLAKGYYRLEVWLAVRNSLDLPPATQLGTYLKIRAPGQLTAEPLQPSRVWHRVQ